ncbi:MAG: hypothetical protein ACO3UU_08860, partial [Minisyncoccia bacterium]
MSSTNNYNTYRPTKLKVSRFGVNLSDTTNENLNLASSQYMIVGERQTNQGGVTCNVYSLQVDNEGIAVNMSLSDRETNKADYPTQLSGSLYVDGNIILTGVITGETSSNILGGSSNFWRYSANDNIYYNGKVNIGDYGDTIGNTYSLNIVEPANKNINKSQLSIQNGQLSEFRTAILGDASNSPIIFNTRQQSPIEFHVGRDTQYFNTVYTETYWNADEGASNTRQIDIPVYGNSSNNSPPNLVIDPDGNVGINTNTSKRYSYLQRKPNTDNANVIEYTSIYESMNMYVDGPLYARDVLMYDYETATAKSLDDIYTRRIGEFIEACNIIPGEFPEGIFIFNSNVSILTTDTSEALNIGGNINCEGDITATNITTTNSGTFNNNITVNNNVYFSGNLYKEIFNEETGEFEYVIISLDNYSFSNITAASNLYNLTGGGVATTGRLGVGVYAYGSGPDVDEVNHQHVVRKRNPGIYELELMDKSSPYIKKTAWIGHPQVGDRSNDASLIFITPKSTNPEYNLYYSSSPQNIYFFPGFE